MSSNSAQTKRLLLLFRDGIHYNSGVEVALRIMGM